MPGETALSNVRKYDFFAILGSGSYVVGCCGLLFAEVSYHNQNPTAAGAIKWLSGKIEGHWPVAAGSLFLAFLIGNALRALPVNQADGWWKKSWFEGLHKKTKSPFESALRKGLFPYPDLILGELKALTQSMLVGHKSVVEEIQKDLSFALQKQEDGENIKTPEEVEGEETRLREIWHSTYNFWKAELCRESVAAFEYTQELEGRVRLFATMMWASSLGFFAGFIGLLFSIASLLGTGWIVVMLIMVILSAIIFFIFGSYLRRVRGQEVAAVFLAYVSLTLKRSREMKLKTEKPMEETI